MIANILGTTEGTFGSVDHYVHRKRRAAVSKFFSDNNIDKSEAIVRRHVENFSARLRDGGSAVWELRVYLTALKIDIFTEVAFGTALGLQEEQKKAIEWDDTMEAIGVYAPLVKMFPWILPIAVELNPTLVNLVSPAIARLLVFRHVRDPLLFT
jgi:hypothetical protein